MQEIICFRPKWFLPSCVKTVRFQPLKLVPLDRARQDDEFMYITRAFSLSFEGDMNEFVFMPKKCIIQVYMYISRRFNVGDDWEIIQRFSCLIIWIQLVSNNIYN